MSLVLWQSSWFSVAPRVDAGPTWLFATSSPLWSWLTLASSRRELLVDGRRRRFTLKERSLWRTTSREIPFDTVEYVDYRFAALPTSFIAVSRFRRLSYQADDRWERFVVELVLREGPPVQLFSFVGEGAALTGGLGTLLGDSVVDLQGEQEDESKRFVRHLLRLTGLPLGAADRIAAAVQEAQESRKTRENRAHESRGRAPERGGAR